MTDSNAETREQELAQLIAEQRAEDTARQRPERHGGDHGAPVLSLDALRMTDVSTDLDGVAVSGAGMGGEYDESKGPGLTGRYKQRTVAPLYANVEDANSEAARIVREALDAMTDEQRETYRLVFGERLSERAAAERLGISQPAVHQRVETLKRIVTRALVAASGGNAEEVA